MVARLPTGLAVVCAAGLLVVAGCGDEDEADDIEPDAARADTGDTGPSDDVDGGGRVAREVDCGEVEPETTISIVDFAYEPEDASIETGQVVQWTNDGNLPHTTTSGQAGGDQVGDRWDSDNLAPGDLYCLEFLRTGAYEYFCTLHPQRMEATLTVE